MLFNSRKYNFDWESVTIGFWRKSPSKYLPYINNVHTINTKVLPEQKCLTVHRMYHVRFNFPYLIQKFVGNNTDFYLLEESVVDLDKRRLSYKISGVAPDYYSYDESASFEESSSPGTTDFATSIDVRIRGFGVMNKALEKFCQKAVFESLNRSNDFNAMVESISSNSR
ncbi:uncharacterized protein TOT_030000293 [Theileria orientalis strain Shintoku]|uniref:PRELI/MSF1 domain-containing protein n=1 Tax=Theileria orientalis strain Shintoku TaxID=869250 RepID=J4CDF1_THEOR|nr:uncharacterized protein TOT_030000293 [Theileria orientalis strain Shintoku]BAM41032.1 uncharacterized protein TOT_030000293 [Theileria orientalis strain Shintoku]|eukprot:XP_009691333.1 uncharacterized protein TOT_030000293 [Theileria orientalis strain Shintoku]